MYLNKSGLKSRVKKFLCLEEFPSREFWMKVRKTTSISAVWRGMSVIFFKHVKNTFFKLELVLKYRKLKNERRFECKALHLFLGWRIFVLSSVFGMNFVLILTFYLVFFRFWANFWFFSNPKNVSDWLGFVQNFEMIRSNEEAIKSHFQVILKMIKPSWVILKMTGSFSVDQ